MTCNVFQIYLSDDGQVAPRIGACMDAVAANTPGYQYRSFDKRHLRAVIQEHFPAEVLSTYDALRPYAYKADLGRYCLLYHFGGWYIDSTVVLQSELPDPQGYQHVLFKDATRSDLRPGDVAIGLMYAKAGSSVLDTAIRMIVQNCETGNFGSGPLDPTGPGLFGAALNQVGGGAATLTGSYIPLTPGHPRKNYAFVLPEGTILAWGKATHGTTAFDGLSALGAKGTNSYNALWERGLIYAHPNLRKRYWTTLAHVSRRLLKRLRQILRLEPY